ncbi:retrovirus-related Pol polyprotein from transposon TNT 1-94, partial [Trichonephila clavata]
MEIVKKPLQIPEADVEKEMEEISCNAEDTEETLVQHSRNLRDRKILSHFDMINSNPVGTPIEKGAITSNNSVSLSADVPYREAVGSLMFLAIVTRPDIAYAVGVLSQVLDKPQQMHWTMVKRIL